METRSRRHASVDDDEAIEVQLTEKGRELTRDSPKGAFAKLEDEMLQRLTSSVLRPERIATVAEDHFSTTFGRIDGALRKVAADQNALRKDFEGFTQEPCKDELKSLRDELAALRDHTKAEFEKLWRLFNSLKNQPQAPQNPDEPDEDVQVVDDPSPAVPRGKDREHTRKHKSRARKSSTHARKRRGRRYRESDSDSTDASTSDADDYDYDVEDDIRVADKDCEKVLSVETYRLLDREPERDLGLRTAKVLQNLQHLFNGERFDGTDPLTVLPFLEELKTAFDDAGLAEGDAKHMVRYFLTGDAARLFKGLAPIDKRSYPRIVKWLLRTYVRESMLQDAREKFLTRAQNSNETELEYSHALSDLSKRCAGMISEKELINRFVRGLRPAIRTHVQGRVAKNTSWAVAVAIATEHGTAHREAQKEQASHRDSPFLPQARKRASMGTGKTLTIKPHVDDDSSLDEWWGRAEHPAVAKGSRVDDAIGVLRYGSAPPSREGSFASLPTSIGSSAERYYTPRATMDRSAARDRPLPTDGRKVMLPPGVPFPSKGSPATDAQPCLGCGKTGHWLVDCQLVPASLKELALVGLRTRKEARRVKLSEGEAPVPRRVRTGVLLTTPAEEENANPDAPEKSDERESKDKSL